MAVVSKIKIRDDNPVPISGLFTQDAFEVTNPVGRVLAGTIIEPGTRVEDVIQMMLQKYAAPKGTVSVVGKSTAYNAFTTAPFSGVVVKIVVTQGSEPLQKITITKNKQALAISTKDDIALYIDQACKTKATALTGGTYYYKDPASWSSTTSITGTLLEERASSTIAMNTTTIGFYHPIIFGKVHDNGVTEPGGEPDLSVATVVTEDDINADDAIVKVQSTKAYTGADLKIPIVNQCVFFLVPAALGALKSIQSVSNGYKQEVFQAFKKTSVQLSYDMTEQKYKMVQTGGVAYNLYVMQTYTKSDNINWNIA